MKKITFFFGLALLCLLLAFATLENRIETVVDSELESSPEAAQDRPYKSSSGIGRLLETIFHRSQSTTPTHIDPIMQFDKSECGLRRQLNQSARVEFAGYLLEFPCTSNANGNIFTEHSDGQEHYRRYTLYLTIQIWDGNDTIWSDGTADNDLESSERFVLVLRSDGKPKTSPFFTNIDQYTFIRTISESNTDVYIKNDSTIAVGLLKSGIDAVGQHPRVSCPLSDRYDAEDMFTPSLEIEYAARPCGAGWNLTDDITISILRLRPGLASEFGRVFQTINPEIQKIIKRRPETTAE